MAEEALELENVASVAQEFDSEGVAKAVQGDTLHAAALAQALDEVAQAVAFEGLGGAGDEDGIAGAAGGPLDKVAPEGGFCALGGEDDAIFAAFALFDYDLAGGAVVVAQAQVDEFAGAQAGIEEKQKHGAVTQFGGAGVLGAFAVGSIPAGAEVGGFEEGGDIGACVGEYLGAFVAGALDVATDDVGHVEGFFGPGPEGGEGHPAIGAGFAAKLKLFDHVVEEFSDVVGDDLRQVLVADEDPEAAKV